MNLKTTPLLFGLLLGVLWLFGLMVTYKRTAVDQSALVPTLQGPDAKIDTVLFQYKGGKDKEKQEDVLFVREDDAWYLKQHGQKVKVEGFRVDSIVRQIKDAKKYEEFTPTEDLGQYELASPRMTVTLKGKVRDRDKEVKFYVGKDSPDKLVAYVNSSDFPNKAYAVVRSNVDALFFKDPGALRSKRVFDFVETTVSQVEVSEGKQELVLKKTEEGIWKFEKPPLGFAGFEGPAGELEAKKEKDLPGQASANVKSLVNAIGALRVDEDDDFVPLGTDPARYGVEAGGEAMRIQVATGGGKSDKAKETLLVGKKVPQRDQYYARHLNDDGVMKISAKLIEPIRKAVADPGKIRSHDVAFFETKNVDAVVVTKGPQSFKLLRPEGQLWQVAGATDKPRRGDEKAIQAFLDAIQGKKAIIEFYDGKDEGWGGLKNAVAEISVYAGGLDKDKKDEAADEKKDDKKADAKDKKQAKKDDLPALKKDAKPVVTLAIGSTDKEVVHVQRTLQDGTVSRFTVPKSFVAKFELDQGGLAYADKILPLLASVDAVALELKRGKETLEVTKEGEGKTTRWFLKDPQEPAGKKPADAAKVGQIVNGLAGLQPRKWVGKAEALKGELEKFGLQEPALTATVRVRREDQVPSPAVASLLGLLGGPTVPGPLPAAASMAANRAADRGEPVTFSFGKEVEEKGLVYARRTGEDLLFLVPAEVTKSLREADLRDRSLLVNLQPMLDASAVAVAALNPEHAALLASPAFKRVVNDIDPAKVKELKLAIRTPVELRTVTFQRTGKDKATTWEASGLQEFQTDPDKVKQAVEALARLKADRFVSFAGVRDEFKLGAKESSLRAELTLEEGGSVIITVGAAFERHGYFAHSSAWPDAVFLLPAATVEPWLRGVGYFSKERVAAAP